LHQAVKIKLERERQSPMGLPLPSDIVVPEEPQAVECPWDEDYDDSNEYDDLINH
jgi:hypothetical protein